MSLIKKKMENRSPEKLVIDKKYYREKCTSTYSAYVEAKDAMIKLREVWEGWRVKFEDTDRALAEIDGRKTIIVGVKKKETKAPDPVILTIDQIKDIAKKVGIVLDLEEECNFD